ncbi:MAG: hypothetical protein ACKPBB_04045, partial [Sphaerospermopsis kisseleviana]
LAFLLGMEHKSIVANFCVHVQSPTLFARQNREYSCLLPISLQNWDAPQITSPASSPVPSPQSPVPSPQSPVPSPQSPFPIPQSPFPSPHPPVTNFLVRSQEHLL